MHMTIRQAGELLGVHLGFLYDAVQTGKLKTVPGTSHPMLVFAKELDRFTRKYGNVSLKRLMLERGEYFYELEDYLEEKEGTPKFEWPHIKVSRQTVVERDTTHESV